MTDKSDLRPTHPLTYSRLSQVSLTIVAFVVTAIILDAKGLVTWAERLEEGRLKTIAEPATQWLDATVAPLGLSGFREPAMQIIQTDNLWQKLTENPSQNPQDSDSQTPDTPTLTTSKPSTTQQSATSPVVQKATSTGTATSAPNNEAIAVPTQTPLPASLQTLNTKQNLNIVLTGDSMMAVGLSPAIQQTYADDKKIHFVQAFKSGTGLSRPDVFNWLENYPKLTATAQPDLIIVAIGANDAQDVTYQGKKYHFDTPEWNQLYQQRVETFITTLSPNAETSVIWMGLPAMRLPKFDQKIHTMNQLIYGVIQRHPNVTWWNPNPYLTKPDGSYNELGKDSNGQVVRLRGQDGIHLSEAGANLLVPTMFGWYQH